MHPMVLQNSAQELLREGPIVNIDCLIYLLNISTLFCTIICNANIPTPQSLKQKEKVVKICLHVYVHLMVVR